MSFKSFNMALQQRQGVQFFDSSKARAVLTLSHTQVRILFYVDRYGAGRLERGQLRDKLFPRFHVLTDSERSSFSRSLKRLEKVGLIEQFVMGCRHYRSGPYISLTGYGHEVISWLMNDWPDWATYSQRNKLAG